MSWLFKRFDRDSDILNYQTDLMIVALLFAMAAFAYDVLKPGR